MTATDPAMTALAHSWSALSLLHGRIESKVERALQAGHRLSAREYSLLDVLSRQHDGEGGHLQMRQVADSVVLSQSATTRLVTRLEDRGLLSRYLCPTDRRGIYTDVTDDGLRLLEEARPHPQHRPAPGPRPGSRRSRARAPGPCRPAIAGRCPAGMTCRRMR
ncbi:DNA-binding MarR family transcriptional regulator [Streptosporangium brasiliense]|uniref:DNA-binding MarR family transcriptional regulator n=1 Tax=Streptosporangium brasiliense TaxID=47480 RepID=A0ABT9RK08_9ACTN|nr:DNA-binding MarR family transcriptional regulator [Streptosporangium brasiliense]